MYWPKDQKPVDMDFQGDRETIHIAYLGSVNHIIDIEGIAELLAYINQRKKVKLHIIGTGKAWKNFRMR